MTLGSTSAGAQVPPTQVELSQIEEAVEAQELRAMMAHRRRVRVVVEGAFGFSSGSYLIATNAARISTNDAWVFSLHGGVRWGALPALDLRATLGLTSPTTATLRAKSDGRCASDGSEEQSVTADVTAMTAGLTLAARVRPSPRTPLYLGLGLGGALMFTGGGSLGVSCYDRRSATTVSRWTTDVASQTVPMFGWQVEYGAQFGAGERYDVGLRLSGQNTVGQDINGNMAYYQVYFGGAI
ncbi:MAG: hypothetical protein U0326_05560 [Polyangiales bacterium]